MNYIYNLLKLVTTYHFFKLPLNNETLTKLTEDFIVSNLKIKTTLNIKSLPISSKEGIIKTITNFKENN